ncbi:MAG: XRE family transcriptional regulator [Bacteroidetes bacterium HGW-Bacteroidetes-2]|jgi:predicted DNA-binding mobile mystery protein A|nr:MAG: XRE family transcriptional regulator [Bacteroidetes bacterium HGW-Bacteroidetes-2]
MRNNRKLLLEQLSKKLQPFIENRKVLLPERGWIHTIRTTLNMTLAQLGGKLNMTRQGVKKIEESEANGTITINSLKNVAHVLDLQLVYALVPKNGTLDDLIEARAQKLAQKIVSRTHHNMKLEDQGITDDKINKAINELASELKREMKKSLWD